MFSKTFIKLNCTTWLQTDEHPYLYKVKADFLMNRPPGSEWVIKYKFSYSSPKTYVVGDQKNRLNETVLLSTQNKCLNEWKRKFSQFYAKNFFIWTFFGW